jgi:hypothetical protein
MAWRVRVLILLTLGVLCAGCSRTRDEPLKERFTYATGGRGAQNYIMFWAHIHFDGQPVGLVVSNSWGQTSGSSGVAFMDRDGRGVRIDCRGTDPGSTKVTIDGQEFDLSAGALFLVSVPGKPARVRQVVVDIGPLGAIPADTLWPLGEKNPEVRAFLDSCLTPIK